MYREDNPRGTLLNFLQLREPLEGLAAVSDSTVSIVASCASKVGMVYWLSRWTAVSGSLLGQSRARPGVAAVAVDCGLQAELAHPSRVPTKKVSTATRLPVCGASM